MVLYTQIIMTKNKSKPARFVALEILGRLARGKKKLFAGQVINRFAHLTKEKGRLNDLVFTTLRNRDAIDNTITQLADCTASRIPDRLLNAIRIGCCEIIYMPLTPLHAIVNETVEIVKGFGGKKQVAFVNAVLRETARHIIDRDIDLENADMQRTLPQNRKSGCQFDRDILPDRKKEAGGYLSRAFSMPNWLIARWLEQFGFEKTEFICFASNRRPSIYLRVNRLKVSAEKLRTMLSDAGFDCQATRNGAMLKITNPGSINSLPGFNGGLFTVQDITASKPVQALAPCADSKILDLCAAPGTKTTQLAELTNDDAKIFATDIDAERLKSVEENISRLNLKSISIIDYTKITDYAPFDYILLDVPCSNTGVLAKRPEVRHRLTAEALDRFAKTQSKLLNDALKWTNTGSKLCYSTCSILDSENSELVYPLLREKPQLKLEHEHLTIPRCDIFDNDGGYYAILTKR